MTTVGGGVRARSLCWDTSSPGGAELEARKEAMGVGMGLVDLQDLVALKRRLG